MSAWYRMVGGIKKTVAYGSYRTFLTVEYGEKTQT